jgi:proteasome lid subunit RPN8/RPN11
VPTERIESVSIVAGVLTAITAHARADAPRECCGLLVGTASRIDESVPTTNVAARSTRFRVDPQEHIALNRHLRGTPRQVIGVYHSHPHSRAEPSPTDIAEAYYPEFIHVIVSLAVSGQPDVRAFRIRGGVTAPVALVVLD